MVGNISFERFCLDQLQGLGDVTCRRMFGGAAFYSGGVCFAIAYKASLHFKTDAATQAEYEKRGMKPFRPNARMTLKSYYEVPAEVIENRAELVPWARTAIESQRRAAAGTRGGPPQEPASSEDVPPG